jgi:hypothetical protein
MKVHAPKECYWNVVPHSAVMMAVEILCSAEWEKNYELEIIWRKAIVDNLRY